MTGNLRPMNHSARPLLIPPNSFDSSFRLRRLKAALINVIEMNDRAAVPIGQTNALFQEFSGN